MAYLSRIRLAFLLIPAFVAGFAFALGVNTGKTTTMGSLRGGTLGAASNISYQTGRHGLQTYYTQHLQSYGGKMYQLPARAKTPTSGLIKGLRNLLKSPAGKTHVGLIVGAWALDGIIEELGIFEQDGQLMYQPDRTLEIVPLDEGFTAYDNKLYSTPRAVCAVSLGCKQIDACNPIIKGTDKDLLGPYVYGWCIKDNPNNGYGIWRTSKQCPSNTVLTDEGCALEGVEPVPQPVTDAMIDALNFGNWTPPDSVPIPAVERVYPYILPADTTIDFDPITVTAPAETVTAPDGSVKQRTTTETVSVSSPNTDPALQVSVKTTTNTYQNGLLTDTQSTTTTTDATAASPNQTQQQQITDCAFFPTLCKWLDWTQQPPPSDADLPALMPIKDLGNIEQKKDVRFGAAVCPTSSKVYIATIRKTVDFDWAFICQIAEKIKYFILAAAYLMAIRINLGVLSG